MANTRIELDLTKFVSKKIATGVTYMRRGKELFLSAKADLAAVDYTVPENMVPLLGSITPEQATALWTIVNAVTADATTVLTIAGHLPKLDQGVEV
jgi:hypothetical protein